MITEYPITPNTDKQVLVIQIPHRLPCLNEMEDAARRNKYAAATMRKKFKGLCQVCIREANKQNLRFEQIVIHILWREPNKRRDPDNICAGIKIVLDALVAEKVILNDGWKQVRRIENEFVVRRDNPGLMVVVREW